MDGGKVITVELTVGELLQAHAALLTTGLARKHSGDESERGRESLALIDSAADKLALAYEAMATSEIERG